MKIEDVEGIGPAFAQKLSAAGVATTDALLDRGATSSGRDKLSEETGISERLLLEWDLGMPDEQAPPDPAYRS